MERGNCLLFAVIFLLQVSAHITHSKARMKTSGNTHVLVYNYSPVADREIISPRNEYRQRIHKTLICKLNSDR